MLLEALHERLVSGDGRRVKVRIQTVQPLNLLRCGILQVSHLIGCKHRAEDGAVAGHQLCHERVGIVGAAIAQLQGIGILLFKQLSHQFPSRNLLSEVVVGCHDIPEMQHLIGIQHRAMIYKHHLVIQSIVFHNILIGVIWQLLDGLHLLCQGGEQFL